jgi:hypothetical protein
MPRTTSSLRRPLLFALALLTAGAPCCGGANFTPASQVTALRVLGVTADKPYAAPGDVVTFRMTYADALNKTEPRPIEITWLGGCVNPFAGEVVGCFPKLAATLEAIASGMMSPAGLFKQETTMPEQSGVPDAVSFDMTLPDNILDEPEVADETGTVYSTAYAFFIACAGKIRIAAETGEVSFPLECVGDSGKVLSPDSFIVGYTQVYVFADGRTNENPPVDGLTLDGTAIEEPPGMPPVVPKCTPVGEDEPRGGCGRQQGPECKTFKIEATVADVAELDPEAAEAGAGQVREAVWVDYYADGGAFSGAKKLIHDPTRGYQVKHATTWTPPAEAGLVTLWAVVHDARGGASVTQRVVRVE